MPALIGSGLTQSECRSRQFRLDAGYSELWRRLAADLDVRHGVAVTQISQLPDRSLRVVTAPASAVDGTNPDSLAAAALDEKVYIAQRVIVTVPLAVLQRDAIAFEPALSAPKQRAIAGLGAGQCAKVVLTFEEAFWPQDMSFLFTARPSQIIWRPSEGHSGTGAERSTTITAFFAGRDCKRLAAGTYATTRFVSLKRAKCSFLRPNLTGLMDWNI